MFINSMSNTKLLAIMFLKLEKDQYELYCRARQNEPNEHFTHLLNNITKRKGFTFKYAVKHLTRLIDSDQIQDKQVIEHFKRLREIYKSCQNSAEGKSSLVKIPPQERGA